jgi:TatD DNase family protein
MAFTDSHAHLTSVAERIGADALRDILDEWGAAASAAAEPGAAPQGATAPVLVDIGTEPDDLPARAALLEPARRASFLRLSAGVWPSAESLADPRSSLDGLEAAIEAAGRDGIRVAAVGEGGLDYHHMEGPREAQAALFEGQLELAARLGLPMIVHSREAFEDTLAIVARAARAGHRVVIHCFGYGPAQARGFLDSGCLVSFAGNLTYKGADSLRDACALVPPDRLLLETDAPYMNPMPRRGRPSSPRDVSRTYEAAASLRGVTVADLAETVSRNARSLFG